MGNKKTISVTDAAILVEILRNYPLATVISHVNNAVEVSQLPLVVETNGDGNIQIRGHLSKRNPQWRHLTSGAALVLVFNGPNTYINSSWYKKNDVSTWNYITVQAEGTPKLIENYDGLLDILKATTDLTNQLYKDQWDFYIPEDLRLETDLINSIGGFLLEPTKLFGKFKLSQSKSIEDQQRIIKELSLRDDENSKAIAKFMADNIE